MRRLSTRNLTPAQIELVIKRITEGLTRQQIAARLGISPDSVLRIARDSGHIIQSARKTFMGGTFATGAGARHTSPHSAAD